jgi:hypothetical protein
VACNEHASKTKRDLYILATQHIVRRKVEVQPAGEKK